MKASWRALATWFEQVEASAWSAAAAWCALIISFANLWYSVIRAWWRTRAASPSAQLELVNYQTQSEEWKEEERVVVTNHGPATMREIYVDAEDEYRESFIPTATARWLKMPVDYLHVGQSLYLQLDRSPGHLPPRKAVIRWRDRRRRQQERWIDLSFNRVV